MPMAQGTTVTPSLRQGRVRPGTQGQAREGEEWPRAQNTTAPFPSATNSFLSRIH